MILSAGPRRGGTVSLDVLVRRRHRFAPSDEEPVVTAEFASASVWAHLHWHEMDVPPFEVVAAPGLMARDVALVAELASAARAAEAAVATGLRAAAGSRRPGSWRIVCAVALAPLP